MKEHGISEIQKNKRVKKEHRIDYQIEVQNRLEKNWYIRRYGLSLKEARRYLKERNSYMPEPMRIVKCEVTWVTTVLE